MADNVAELLERVKMLEAALKPFARAAEQIDARGKELGVVISEHASCCPNGLFAGDFWRARQALSGKDNG